MFGQFTENTNLNIFKRQNKESKKSPVLKKNHTDDEMWEIGNES